MCLRCIPRNYRQERECRWWVWGLTICVVGGGALLLLIILPAITVNQKVAQDEYAVFVNRYTTEVSGIHSQGAYTLAVGDAIIRFPRTFQHLDFPLIQCMSYDQLVLDLTVSLQFQYHQEAIIPIIMMQFGDEENYQNFFRYKIMSSIIDTCGNYTAEDYYTVRAQIEGTMFQRVVGFIEDSDLGLEVIFLQLKNIDFPDQFAKAITTKQLVQQDAVTQTNSRTSQLIKAGTGLLESQKKAQITVINANNTARINVDRALTERNVIVEQWRQRGIAYNSVKTNLHLNDSQFINYLEFEIVRNGQHPVVNLGSV